MNAQAPKRTKKKDWTHFNPALRFRISMRPLPIGHPEGLSICGKSVGVVVIDGSSYLYWNESPSHVRMRKVDTKGSLTAQAPFCYDVADVDGRLCCTCPDYYHRHEYAGTACKHIAAAWFLNLLA